ncbi:MAG: hypothetical protein MI920_13915 [Kiloniellales bacterium]|nr:hypothetical protein [Kiloniellales bacterium]
MFETKRFGLPHRPLGYGLAAILLTTALAGCEQEVPILRVGSKDFTESMILSEMMALMAEREGITVQRAIPYGTPAVTFEGLKQGKIDVYPEYNGTGLVFLGQAPLSDGDAAFERVSTLYADLGLDWRGRFGFSNDYVLVVKPETARAQGITKISDLAGLGAVSIATDVTFTQRPLDGLGAMVRRYGLETGKVLSYSLAEDGKAKIMQALLDNEVVVAEMFRTDPQIDAFNLVVLEDDLTFFPVYEASPLVRSEALAKFPTLSAALARLEGKITADAMRGLIAEVELDGRSVPAVALDYLVSAELLDATQAASGAAAADPLTVAMGELDSLSGPAGKAVRAARSVFPKRPIEVRRAPNPLELVTSGDARLSVAGIESFYELAEGEAQVASTAEALGVIGYRLAHVVTSKKDIGSLADVKKLGVGQAGSASDRVARMVLSGIGAGDVQLVSGASGDLKAQFEAMTKGLVDAIFVMAPLGDKTALDLMKGGTYRLLPINGWNEGSAPLRFSFLRSAKVPAGTYAGQSGAVETLSTQVVLAGPSGEREEFGAQGPGTTGTAATQPIPAETVRELAEALGATETVDPAAPTAAALRPELEDGPQPLVADAATSIINILAMLFIVWMVYLLVARSPRQRRPS